MESELSIVHVVASLHPRYGGPSRTVVQLTDSLSAHPELAITVVSQGAPGESTVHSTAKRVDHRVLTSHSKYALKLGIPMRQELDEITKKTLPSLIHNHGLWLPVNHWAATTARQNGIPLITHPRGMLEPWAMNYNAGKKRIAMALFQRRDLETARVMVATSTGEYESIRKLGFRQPVALIPNGVAMDSFLQSDKLTMHSSDSERAVLFLSRIHPKKGLLNLIHAWSELAPLGWNLIIAGPDEVGHLREVMSLVRQLDVDSSVQYVGEVDNKQKLELYRIADLFVLPSFSENFGIVVAEALAQGVPVIATHGTPWEGLVDNGCGWWVEPTPEALTIALREATGKGRMDLLAMGEAGRAYAREFSWEDIAQKTVEVYRWVLGQGAMPECIISD